MNNAKLFILLVGEHTKNLYKFVRWEIETAIAMDLPIIVVNLNGKKEYDKEYCPAIARDTLAIHIPYKKMQLYIQWIIGQSIIKNIKKKEK